MSKKLAKKFGKYSVTLEVYSDSDGDHSDCHIEYKDFGSSLAYAEDTGELFDNDTEQTHAIDEQTLTAIREWAEANGY